MSATTTASTASLVAATVTSGLAAGTYCLFAHTIMPGLAGTDDRTFVGAFQAIDQAITNPWFLGGTFFGSLGLTVAAAVATRGEPAWPWTVIAAGGALVTTAVTFAVHLPLNDAIKAAGDPGAIADLAGVRLGFHETRWRAWNLLRSATSLGTFASLTWALALHGRS